MNSPRLDPARLAFLIGVPLAWAVLLLFHPNPGSDIYDGLRDEVNAWLIVHLGTLAFIGLIGAALYMLVRDLPGTAARISRVAIGPFVLFYGAGEAVLGLATGVLVRHANDVAPSERGPAADAVQALWDDFITGDLLQTIGAVGWVVAVVAAAVAYRRVGSPLAVSILLALSAVTVLHGPPIGPIGLLLFATAVALLARSQRDATPVETAVPAFADRG
jgi:hypothetical protein